MFTQASSSPKRRDYTFIFITNENSEQYCKSTLAWLEQDYNKRNQPGNHFWHNRRTIRASFKENDALVITNHQDEVVAYMIWSMWGTRAEIDIVEVNEAYRRQGLMTDMLSKFCEKFPELCVLSASVIPSACNVFDGIGWKRVTHDNIHTSEYYKMIKPQAEQTKNHKDGLVLVVCSDNYYHVKNNIDNYHDKMRYFIISLDKQSKLLKPIIIENFDNEGYVGIYFNNKLIADGKAKHLFNYPCASTHKLLIIDKMQTDHKPLLEFMRNWPTMLPKENNHQSNQPIKVAKRRFFELPGIANQPHKKPRLAQKPNTDASRHRLSQSSLFSTHDALKSSQLTRLSDLLFKAFNNSLQLALAAQDKIQCKGDEMLYDDIDNVKADIEHINTCLAKLEQLSTNKLIDFTTNSQWVRDDTIIENPAVFFDVINILKQQPCNEQIQARIKRIEHLCKDNVSDVEVKKSPR